MVADFITGNIMGIKTVEHGTTIRNRLCKTIVLAIRNLMKKREPDPESLDLAAYIVLALENIAESVDSAATAWEKRDYWLKADRFRLEWAWTEGLSERLKPLVLSQNWAAIIPELIAIAQHLGKFEISERNRLGTPWLGSWESLNQRQ